MKGQWVLAVAVAVIAPAAAPGADDPAVSRPWQRYVLLVERNIFSRTRGPTAQAGPAGSRPEPRRERLIKLTGIAQHGGRYVAFLAGVGNGATRAAVGDTVAGSRVVALDLDGLVFEKDGKTTRVEMGGSHGIGSGSAAAGAGATPPQPGLPVRSKTDPGRVAGGSEESVLERLRRRRSTMR